MKLQVVSMTSGGTMPFSGQAYLNSVSGYRRLWDGDNWIVTEYFLKVMKKKLTLITREDGVDVEHRDDEMIGEIRDDGNTLAINGANYLYTCYPQKIRKRRVKKT